MFLQWNNLRQQEIVNAIMARFSIPVVVEPDFDRDFSMWKVTTLGGDLDSAFARMHAKQNSIVQRVNESGFEAITRQDALFMYASQWVEWTLVRDPNDPDHQEMVDLMESWLIVYHTLRSQFPN